MIDKKVLDALRESAKKSVDNSKLLRYIILDILEFGKKKTWADYSLEEYSVAYRGEACRQRYKKFRFESLPKDEWIPGVSIEEEFKELIDEALLADGSKVITTEDMLLPEVPDGFHISRIYSQQSREGLRWLHSLERTKGVDQEEETNKLISTFENIVLQHEPQPIYLLPQSKPTNWAMNVYISDAHIGGAIEDSLFGEKYDKEIYLSRIRTVVDEIEKKHALFGTFDTINIVLGGDLTDGYGGYTSRGGHKLKQNMNDAEQFETFVKSMIDLFNTLVQEGFAKNLRFVSATNDNHNGDWGFACSRAVEIYLNAKFPDVETIVSRDFIFHFKTGNKVHLIAHGKDAKNMARNIPFVLNRDNEMWFENYIQYHGLNKHIPFNQDRNYITVVVGDLHKSMSQPLNKFHYKRLMALTPANDHSDYNYAKGSGYSGFEIDIFDTQNIGVLESRHYFL